ncbi:MAG: hypothetical protein LBI57_06955 [Helicobacteraceae bacterium]|nr:hypothetical protein [Helicobacteraceae bacterium]
MRKVRIAAIAAIGLLALGCASTKTPSPEFDIKVERQGRNVAEINASAIWRERDITILAWSRGLSSDRGWIGFLISFKNLTSEPIIIDWVRSSVHYGATSSVLFLDGQKFIDKNTPPSPTVIPPFASIIKEAYPSMEISSMFVGNELDWVINPIQAEKATLTIGIDSGGALSFYIINLVRGKIPDPVKIEFDIPDLTAKRR